MTESANNKINLKEVYNTILKHKWLIMFFTFMAIFLMLGNLYFKPSIYKSTAIIEIQSEGKKGASTDFLLNAFSSGGSGQIDKEIELLKTFSINKEAIKKINFQARYFKVENYRKVELYTNSPIEIKNIEVYSDHMLGKKIILHPLIGGFKLEIKHSLKEKILKKLFNEEPVSMDKEKIYSYGEKIINDYFQMTVIKNRDFKPSIHFSIYGNTRQIYDKVIVKNLNVMQINKNAPLIQISYLDNIPERANNYVNAIAESFIEENIRQKNQQNNKILTFINEQLDSIKNKLETSENELENYRITNQVIEPSVQSANYINKLSDIELALTEGQLKQRLIENLISFTKHNNNLDAIAPSLVELNDQPTIQLINSLQKLQLQEEEYKTEYTNQYPKLLSVRKQIESIRHKVLLNIKNLKSSILEKNISLNRAKKRYEGKIKTLPTKEKKLVNIKRDYEVSSTMYNYLLKKKTENEIIIVATLSDYKMVDYAHSGASSVKPKRTLMVLVASILGLLSGVIFAFLIQGTNSKITNKESLEELTSLPIYGIIPELKQKYLKLEVYDNPQSPFTESYRSLRTNIQFKKHADKANVILVTSTIAGEGKTTVTANLASVFQMAGYKTIVINLDLRKPTLHNYFDLNNYKGMSTFLSGKDSIQDIVFATKHNNLHAITSGAIPPNPSELLLSNRLIELLDILKKRYDYIFIDTAPVGLVSDTIHLMKYADQNLIVLRENYAEKKFIDNLDNIIKNNHLSNVGLILNSSSSRNDGTAYGYGYGYGYES